MKLFVYKVLTVCLFFFILFHLTFGYTIKTFETRFYNTFSKQKITFFKEKLLKEMNNSLKKEKILKEEDSMIINNHIVLVHVLSVIFQIQTQLGEKKLCSLSVSYSHSFILHPES